MDKNLSMWMPLLIKQDCWKEVAFALRNYDKPQCVVWLEGAVCLNSIPRSVSWRVLSWAQRKRRRDAHDLAAVIAAIRGTQFMEYRPPGSLRLDVGCPDHLGPLFGFLGDTLAKVGG